jgi:glycosyltransferase involved in cell wall biosynthesis
MTFQTSEIEHPKLSLCMIVKDEALVLGPCLESVRGAVDEIIVVDTGSSDETVSIAIEHGASVFEHEWQDDFSLARNISLENSTGDWILFLDADERLDRDSIPKLKEIINKENVEGCRLEFVNYIDDGSSTMKNFMLRLFRNRGYRFTGKIHEQIEHEISKQGVIIQAPIIIHHLGYLSKIKNLKQKGSRNITMLQKELRDSPQNPYLRFQLGSDLGIKNMHDEAIKEFLLVYDFFKELPPSEWPQYAIQTIHLMSKSHYLLDQHQEALQWSDWALNRWKITEILYHRGFIQHELCEYSRAIATFRQCLKWGEVENGSFLVRPGTGDYLAMLAIGKIYDFIGDPETALFWYLKSFEKNHNHPDTVYRLSKLITDTEILESIFQLIGKCNAMLAFCFGCSESGHPMTLKVINALERNGKAFTTHNARLRYLGRRGKTEDQIRFLEGLQGENANLIKFLVSLNRSDMTEVKEYYQRLNAFKADAEKVMDIIKGESRRLNAELIMQLIIDFNLEFLFEPCLLSLPMKKQNEVLLETKLAWKEKRDLTRIKSTCGVAYDLKTEKALKSNDLFQAEIYLRNAFKHGVTISRYLYEMELYRSKGDVHRFRSAFDEAFAKYPDSILLQKFKKEHFPLNMEFVGRI